MCILSSIDKCMTVQGGGSWEAEGSWFNPQHRQNMKGLLVAGEGARTSIEVPFSKVLFPPNAEMWLSINQIQMIQSNIIFNVDENILLVVIKRKLIC